MKYFIGIVLILLVSGCSVDYNLTIDEQNQIYESISIQAENSLESQNISSDPWPIKVFYNDPDSGEYPEKIEGVSYYEDQTILKGNYYQKDLAFKYNLQEFRDVNSIQSCYEHFYLTEDEKEKTVTLSTSSEFLCFEDFKELSNVNIKIKVANPVLSSNAKTHNNDIYEWNINRENYDKSGIILTFKKEKDDKPKIDAGSNPLIAYIILGGFIISIMGIIIYKIKKNS